MLKMPMVCREMSIVSNSFNEKDNTFEVDFTTGAEVRRYSFWRDEEYFESLSLDPRHVRMERIEKGVAPFLDQHYSSRLIGAVLSGRLEKNRGVAKIKLSSREEVKGIAQDIKDGIRKAVSVGYDVYEYQDISEYDEKGKMKKRKLLAVDWEPIEISSVTMPADPDAKVRSIENYREHEVKVNFLENRNVPKEPEKTKEPEKKEPEVASPGNQEDLQRAKTAGIEEERKRQSEITFACRKAKMTDEFKEKLISSGVSIDQVRAQIIDAWQQDGEKNNVSNHVEMTGQDATVTRKEALKEYLLFRGNPKQYQMTEKAREYRGFTLIDIIKESLENAGVKVRGLDKNEIITRGLQGSSDFPDLLSNVASKTLLDGYQTFPQTFLPYVTWVPVPDFKNVSMVRISEAPQFKKIPENGEMKRGTLKDHGKSWRIYNYGINVGLTRVAMINDDLNAFAQLPFAFGVQANMLESDIFWGIIVDNDAMEDGVALFHANHGNLGTAGAISVTTLSQAYEKFMGQKGIDGVTPLNIPPYNIACPVAQFATAAQYSTPVVNQNANDPTKYNIFGNILKPPTAEARLDAVSRYNWYVFGDARFCPIIAIGTLDGIRGPSLRTSILPGFDGMQIDAIYDVGGTALDYRGVFKNPYAG